VIKNQQISVINYDTIVTRLHAKGLHGDERGDDLRKVAFSRARREPNERERERIVINEINGKSSRGRVTRASSKEAARNANGTAPAAINNRSPDYCRRKSKREGRKPNRQEEKEEKEKKEREEGEERKKRGKKNTRRKKKAKEIREESRACIESDMLIERNAFLGSR